MDERKKYQCAGRESKREGVRGLFEKSGQKSRRPRKFARAHHNLHTTRDAKKINTRPRVRVTRLGCKRMRGCKSYLSPLGRGDAMTQWLLLPMCNGNKYTKRRGNDRPKKSLFKEKRKSQGLKKQRCFPVRAMPIPPTPPRPPHLRVLPFYLSQKRRDLLNLAHPSGPVEEQLASVRRHPDSRVFS